MFMTINEALETSRQKVYNLNFNRARYLKWLFCVANPSLNKEEFQLLREYSQQFFVDAKLPLEEFFSELTEAVNPGVDYQVYRSRAEIISLTRTSPSSLDDELDCFYLKTTDGHCYDPYLIHVDQLLFSSVQIKLSIFTWPEAFYEYGVEGSGVFAEKIRLSWQPNKYIHLVSQSPSLITQGALKRDVHRALSCERGSGLKKLFPKVRE